MSAAGTSTRGCRVVRMRSADILTVADIAAAVGVAPVTIRAYVSRGQMPAPSGRVGRTPYWTRKKIGPWIATRVAGTP